VSRDPKTRPSRKLGGLVHSLAQTCESLTIPTDRAYINAIALHVFFVIVGLTVGLQLQKFVMNEPDFSQLYSLAYNLWFYLVCPQKPK